MVTTGEDSVLVLDEAPYAYLMTEAKPFSPSCRDQSFYAYDHQMRDITDIYFHYSSIVGKDPSKIIYVDSGLNGELSIYDDTCDFTEWVKTYYEMELNLKESGCSIIVYKMK